ncbi:unnamed protein product [Chondrus crispus]|uniref:Uncharacterized protein n=1 Tax=Chondrus crispus TaxID=2769 RepID=R7Q376_CHOCR|nr:unnamed protein product [Chondrus crispus]CDF32469.1 unnamed protein product [Chondrus crispus]|eukprot:XP_005712134.1 unnamed protein product [Chondrus crispus]
MFFSVSQAHLRHLGAISLYLDILNLLEDGFCLSKWFACHNVSGDTYRYCGRRQQTNSPLVFLLPLIEKMQVG